MKTHYWKRSFHQNKKTKNIPIPYIAIMFNSSCLLIRGDLFVLIFECSRAVPPTTKLREFLLTTCKRRLLRRLKKFYLPKSLEMGAENGTYSHTKVPCGMS